MKKRTLRWLAAGLLVLWCAIFLRTDNTEKSMVRALLLVPPTKQEPDWTVGLLYQFPEAEADASDADALVRFCTGKGATLDEARTEAERSLPRQASYRICEYLLFGSDSTLADIRQTETFLQEEPVRGISGRVFSLSASPEALAQQTEEAEFLPEQLLQTIKEAAPQTPRLHQSGDELLLPIISLVGDSAELAEESLLLTETGVTRLSPEETQMAQLLQQKSGEHRFELEGGTVTFRRGVVSVEAAGKGFSVALTGQRKAGTAPVSQAQCEQLEALCVQTIRHCWDAGYDLLSLGAVRALRQGMNGETLTTKNACPQVQADVSFLGF